MTWWRPARPILMTTDPIGGVWNYALDLCRELGEHKIAIKLASMGRRLHPSERAQVGQLAHVELFESDFKLEWMALPWGDVAAAGDWLGDLAARCAPRLIHLNQFSYGALDWKVPCLVVGHSCVYSWFQAVKGRLPGAEWQKYQRMVSRGLSGADRVTAPSQWMLSALERNYGRFAAAQPIYNGRDSSRFVPRVKEDLILTSGRLWDEAKNIAVLGTAAAKLDWPIFAAGEITGPHGEGCSLENLQLLGRLGATDLGGWMSRAAIFVLPAYYEPFGLSILEAALAGCALVLGDIASLREIWQDTALFVPPDDVDRIAAALALLIADAPLRKALACKARERALAFTTERSARAYLALYQEMLSKPRSKSLPSKAALPNGEGRAQP
jgi:glycogen synthase